MPSAAEIEAKFWKALKSDRTVMHLNGVDDGHPRPMTAQFEQDRSPIWFFTSKENGLVQKLARDDRAIGTFASKDHDLFATPHGTRRRGWFALSRYGSTQVANMRKPGAFGRRCVGARRAPPGRRPWW